MNVCSLFFTKIAKIICFMNVGSLFLQKILTMKTTNLIKALLVMPVILFIDYILMALFGCFTGIFNPGNDFYTGTYCSVGKIVLVISAIFFLIVIFPGIVTIFKIKTNGPPSKKQESIESAHHERVQTFWHTSL